MPDDPTGGEWTPADVTGMIANPFYAIQLDPGLVLPHETLVTEEMWVQANVGLIDELGAVAYLCNLLQILKGSDVGAFEDDEDEKPLPESDPNIPEAEPGHGFIDADELDGYVRDKICRRLEQEPQFLARSAEALHETLDHAGDDAEDEDLAEEIYDLESDPSLLAEVLRASRSRLPDMSPGAERLLVLYTIDRILVGSPSQSIDDQVRICWRLPAAATSQRVIREKNIGRNDPCPCGSKRKYKRCCGSPQ